MKWGMVILVVELIESGKLESGMPMTGFLWFVFLVVGELVDLFVWRRGLGPVVLRQDHGYGQSGGGKMI